MKNFITTLFLMLALPAFGFSPATPERHVVSSGKFLFVMDPGNFDNVAAKGVAYRANRSGFKKLWEVSGWYGSGGEVFLSSDGKSLVRIERGLNTSGTKLEEEFVLFFYRKGSLQRKYRLSDLVEDVKEGTSTSSFGYAYTYWMSDAEISSGDSYSIETKVEGKVSRVSNPDVFRLTTREGVQTIFDLKTGDVLAKKKSEIKRPALDKNLEGDPFAPEKEAEQAGSGQPTTAPESKPEGSENTKPESDPAPR